MCENICLVKPRVETPECARMSTNGQRGRHSTVKRTTPKEQFLKERLQTQLLTRQMNTRFGRQHAQRTVIARNPTRRDQGAACQRIIIRRAEGAVPQEINRRRLELRI